MDKTKERIYPFLRASKPRTSAFTKYFGELEALGKTGIYAILDQGREWAPEVTENLIRGGGAIFPHTYVSQCGYQMAAVIHGILDSRAEKVILLGTAHGFPGELLEARIREFNNEDITEESSWGILDPQSEKGYLLKKEFSLDLFKALWKIEVERRGIAPPLMFERYPCLANREPATLPGIEALKELSKNAVLVGTDDYCHHGVAYGVTKEAALPIDEKGLLFARNQIELGFAILSREDYPAYFDHWMNPKAIGDPCDVTAVMRYLIGEKASPKILDLKLVDVSPIFEEEIAPSWVAATLALL